MGRGFNALDCSVKTHLFDEIKATHIEEKSKNEKVTIFKNSSDFINEVGSRLKVKTIEPGMFSMTSETRECFPFLSDIERLDSHVHFVVEVDEIYYTLKLKTPTASQLNFMLDEDVQFIMQHIFNKDTKKQYYSVIEKYGTHYVTGATFGAKAEIRWSIPDKADRDPLEKINSQQNLKKRLLGVLESWKQTNFERKEDEKLPKGCMESRKVTDNFLLLNDMDKVHNAYQVSFQLEEISSLFSGTTKNSMETAIKVYLEEMRPRTINDLTEEQTICVYCPDIMRYVRADDHGHLIADSTRINADNQFKIKKKGSKIALKSLKYKEKFISKALISSIFHFHRLQFMGPHESFEVYEDHLKICGNLSGPSFIYIDDDKQLHHDGNSKKKNRFYVLNSTARLIGLPDEIVTESEPLFSADDYTEDILEVKVIEATANNNNNNIMGAGSMNKKQPLKETDVARALLNKKVGKELAKSNSTSSIFIKDTILLPNIDDLTRAIAVKIHRMILQAKMEGTVIRTLDIFSEDRYPLTRSPNTHTIPSIEAVFHFLNTIFKVAKLSAESGIMAMIYVERLMNKTKVKLFPDNWRRLVLSTLMLASKVYEDQAVWNVDFIELFPSINVKELNRLEQATLGFLEFSVSIAASEYVKVYFELRDNNAMCADRNSAIRPLDETDLKKLEVRSANSEKEFEQILRFHKSSSLSLPGDNKPNQGGIAILS